MTLQQLNYLCEIVNSGFNLSRAAKVLHTSQPGVSRYIKLLEEELGLELLVRNKKKIMGLTPGGNAIAQAARHIVSDVGNLKPIARDYNSNIAGRLSIATSHAQARYTLPGVVQRFVKKYPQVLLRLRQGYSSQMIGWTVSGEADLFIGSAPVEPVPDLMLLPCHELHRVVLTLPGHPLLSKGKISLEDLVQYPIITYDNVFASYHHIMTAFFARNLNPKITLSAIDSDIMKTYVRAGLGVAITAHTAYDRRSDKDLRAIDARHLFASSPVCVGMRRRNFLSIHMIEFIKLFAPSLTETQIRRALLH